MSLLVLLSAAHPAAAAPLDPTLALPQLQAMLQASLTGAVDGYFKTAVKGATIATVPCTVLGVVPQAAVDNGDLIMFRAAGPVIEEAGGIAAGMSGSPLYVNDGGEDLLVGAVSYGEYFTSNGLGLATPIEHMMELESALDADPLAARLARTVTLAEPLETGEATIDSVVVAPTSRAARGARRGDGTVVVRSLSALMVSGLPTDTAAYRALKNDFADRGIELRGGFAAGAVGEEPGFETPLVPGSSVGMLHMRGDYWYGGIGTTTYTTAVDGGALVGFGHPMEYDGRLSAFMTNADVIGLWNNADEPHKVLAPGAVRGEITVDSGAGIAGLIGDGPASVPFVCTATNAATGKTITRTSFVTQFAADQGKWPYTDMNAMAFYPALYQVTGDQQYNGHLEYTLQIDVTDGVHDYTIQRQNTWEDSYGWDAAYLAVCDIYSLLMTMTDDPDGTIGMHVTSMRLNAVLSPKLVRARIVDVSVPGGLKTGANTVHVKLYEYGDVAAKVVELPLTIPEGMATNGWLFAKAPYTSVESEGDGWYGIWGFYPDPARPPQTLAERVDDLNGAHGNNMLLVAYTPGDDDYYYYDDYWGEGEPWGENAVVVARDMGEYLTGAVEKSPARVSIRVRSGGPIVTGQRLKLYGMLHVWERLVDQTVKIYGRDAGEATDTLIAEVPVKWESDDEDEEDGLNTFVATLPRGLEHTTTLTALWEGDDSYLSSTGSIEVEVKAKVALKARTLPGQRVRLAAALQPSDAGGRIAFKRQVRGGAWRTIDVVPTAKTGRAVCIFKGKPGSTRIVAEFRGSRRNAKAVSRPITVVLR